MADPLRQPFFKHQPHTPKPQVQAALDAECVWLCQSGELLRIYQVWPDFQTRSDAAHRLIIPRLRDRFLRIDKQVEVNLAIHCHETIVSAALQVQRPALPEPCADKVIPITLFYDKDEWTAPPPTQRQTKTTKPPLKAKPLKGR